MEGWISLHRKFLSWEWYDDNNTKSLFIHCLLKANHSNKIWRGIEIKRGQFFTSINHLSTELKLSIKQIRLSIKKLEKTGEIQIKGASKGTMITVCKYDSYQDNENKKGNQKDKQGASGGQTKGKQRATTNNDNNKNKKNNDNKLLTEIDISELDEKQKYYYQITMSFHELFKDNLKQKDISTKKIDSAKFKWIHPIRLLMEIDEFKHEDLIDVWKFLKVDDFWKKNILSTNKLREKFQDLLIKARKSEKTNNKDAAMQDYKQQILNDINEAGKTE